MKKITRTISGTVLALAALAVAGGVQAQTSSGSSGGGFGMGGYSFYGPGTGYVGLNVGRSDYSIGSGSGGFAFDRHDTSYNLYTGTFFHPNVGLELGYTDFGKVTRAGGQTDAEGINLSLVGRAPLGNSFNLLGKLGTTYGRTHVSAATASGIRTGNESGWGLSYGIGAEFVFRPNLSAVLQWDEHDLKFPGSGRDRISTTSLGLRYRF